MRRGGRAEVCEGADPYLEGGGGGIAASSGFPGGGVFIWACSRLLSEEPDFSPGDRCDYLAWLSLQQDPDTVKASPIQVRIL